MVILERGSSTIDKTRKYKIMVDGENVGIIGDGEIVEFDVKEGEHQIYLSIDWCRSPKISVDIKDNEYLNLSCGSAMKGWKSIFSIIYITFLKNEYIELTEKPS